MQKEILKLLEKWGYEIVTQRLFADDIDQFDQVLISNSLMGTIPALSIDGKDLKPPSRLWKQINEALL